MADPFSLIAAGTTGASLLAGASAATTVAGGAISAAGALASGASQQAMYGYQAGVARLNQSVALQNADYANTVGGSEAYKSGLQTAAIVGKQKADQGASGVDVNSGSAAGIRDTTTSLGQLDQSNIRTNAARKAYGFEVEAATKGTEAGADIVAGDEAGKAATLNASSSILSTVGSVSSKWLTASSAFGKGTSGGSIGTYDPDNYGAAPTWS